MEDILSTTASNRGHKNPLGKTMLFVGGLPLHACDQNLAKHFRKYGPLDTIQVQRNPDGKSRGFAFIEYLRPGDARKALQSSPHVILGKAVSLQLALEPKVAASMTKSRQTRKLYISGIPLQVGESEILAALYNYGSVEKLISPRFGIESRGFCYAVMERAIDYNYLISKGEMQIQLASGEAHFLKVESAISHSSHQGLEKSCQRSIEDRTDTQNLDHPSLQKSENKSSLVSSGSAGSSAEYSKFEFGRKEQSNSPSNNLSTRFDDDGNTLKASHTARYVKSMVFSGHYSRPEGLKNDSNFSGKKFIRVSKNVLIEDICSHPKQEIPQSGANPSSQARSELSSTRLADLRVSDRPGEEPSNYRFNLRVN